MIRQNWLRFSWNLKKLPEFKSTLTPRLKLRDGIEDDIKEIWDTIERSYSLDHGWNIGLKERLREISAAIRDGVNDNKLSYIVLEDGSRIIGASGFLTAASTNSFPQLVTGICVVDEYRCRGNGTNLLYATLKRLSELGLEEASVITKDRINASRFLYPKFGGKSEVLPQKPDLVLAKK